MDKLDPDSLDRHFLALMRADDFKGALQFSVEHTREALLTGDERVIYACHLLIASLIAAGPDQEALDLIWQVAKSPQGDIYLRSNFAGYLLSFLKQPAQALEVLEPAYQSLLNEEESRHGALGLWGAILLEIGRVQEAEDSFREMLQPSLWRMNPAAFDLQLVEALVSRGLMKDECEYYLGIVRKRAQEMSDESVIERADYLLHLLRRD
jgi:tetratricopeptide (TPR) repeat protein